MRPIERLQEYIHGAHPQATITLTPPLSEDGVWSMDVGFGDKALAIEWSRATGFGVSSLGDESYGERPDEAFQFLNDVQRRVTQLLSTDERTSPPLGVLLSRLREIRGSTQEELASKLGVRQATVSGMERRGDIQFSTLRRVIRALGGSLELFAVFPEARYRIGPCAVGCAGDGHTALSGTERQDDCDRDFEARFEELSKCGQLSRAKTIGEGIRARGTIFEMAA